MDECIFCKIVKKEIPTKIVYEDEHSMSFLDIQPRSKGMCIIVPKQHFASFDDNFESASKLFDTALIIGEKIKKSLNPLTIFISVIQSKVPHFHIRVYPVYEDQIPLIENKPLEVSESELNDLAKKIKNENVEWKGRKIEIIEKKEEKPKEEPKKKKSKEDLYWERRKMDMG